MRVRLAVHSHSNQHLRVMAHLALPAILVVTLLAGFATPVLAAEDPPVFLFSWGSSGGGEGEFRQPHGVALDSFGNVFVADTDNHRVQQFYTDGEFNTQWGTLEPGDFCLVAPWDVAVDCSGDVYVSDYSDHCVKKFTYNWDEERYDYVLTIGTVGTPGTADGDFNAPMGIAVDTAGNLYVADSNNHRIQKFDSSGAFLTKWGTTGTYGSADGQFYNPSDVAIDIAGYVYVTDLNNYRIQKFEWNEGTTTYDFVTKWGSPGSDDGEFESIWGIAVDSSGDVYVTDIWNNHVQKFDGTGVFLTKWGASGTATGYFDWPWGLAVNADGDIYVAEALNDRIQVFGGVEIELSLATGWNMVSVPVEAADMSVDVVFPDAVAVYTWNPTSKSYEAPTTIEPEVGYWVAMTAADTVTVTGAPVETWTQDIALGWNMIGSTYGDALATSCLTTETTPDPLQRTAIYSWNPDAKSYQGVSDITQGWGYWVASTADCTATLAPAEP